MKKIIIIGLIALASCDEGFHKGPNKTEKGVVVEKQFAPEINTSATGINFGKGGGLTVSEIYVPEKYLIFFKCEHQVIFYQESKDLWATLNRQDSVFIDYYEILDKDNKIHDLKFINAYKIHP